MTSSNSNNFRVTGSLCGEFPSQKPVRRRFDVFFDLCLNKLLSIQPRRWCSETQWRSLWRHCSEILPRNPLRWRHNGCYSVSNHQPHDCLLNCLFRLRSKKTSKLYVTGLCAGNSPGTGEFSAQMASNEENVSIWWRHNVHTALHGMSGQGDAFRTTGSSWVESTGHR